MRASHVIGIILIVIGIVGVVASLGGYGFGATLPWLVAIALIGIGLWAIASAVAGKPAAPTPPVAPMPAAAPSPPAAPPWGPPSAAAPGTGASAAFTAPPPPPAGPGPAPAWGAVPPVAVYNKGLGDIEMAGPMILGPSRYETFIGEVKLDFTQAVIPEGETAISVNTVLGEIRVLAPADVGVAVRVGTLLGSTEVLGRKGGSVSADEMAVTDDYATASRRLRIEARTVLGDVAIRRAKPLPWQPAPAPPPAAPTAAVEPPAEPPPVAPSPAEPPAAEVSPAEPPAA